MNVLVPAHARVEVRRRLAQKRRRLVVHDGEGLCDDVVARGREALVRQLVACGRKVDDAHRVAGSGMKWGEGAKKKRLVSRKCTGLMRA